MLKKVLFITHICIYSIIIFAHPGLEGEGIGFQHLGL